MSVSVDFFKFCLFLAETHSGTVGWEPSALPVRPIRTPHLNGVNGVFVPQLGIWLKLSLDHLVSHYFTYKKARLVFRLCPYSEDSAAFRSFIDFHGLEEFASQNKATVVYIRPEPNHPPQVSAEWLNGDIEVVSLQDMVRDW